MLGDDSRGEEGGRGDRSCRALLVLVISATESQRWVLNRGVTRYDTFLKDHHVHCAEWIGEGTQSWLTQKFTLKNTMIECCQIEKNVSESK